MSGVQQRKLLTQLSKLQTGETHQQSRSQQFMQHRQPRVFTNAAAPVVADSRPARSVGGAAEAAALRAKGLLTVNGETPGLKRNGDPVPYCPAHNKNGHDLSTCWGVQRSASSRVSPPPQRSERFPADQKQVTFAAAAEIDEEADFLKAALLQPQDTTGTTAMAVASPVASSVPLESEPRTPHEVLVVEEQLGHLLRFGLPGSM